MSGKWWGRNQIRKQYKRDQHDANYKFPMCHLCDSCEYDALIEEEVCRLLNNKKVGASVFGRNSPRCCPKRENESK